MKEKTTCKQCNGSGKIQLGTMQFVPEAIQAGGSIFEITPTGVVICAACKGKGYFYSFTKNKSK